MTISATITSKGQVTIPKPIRDLLNLTKNDLLVFTVKKPKTVTVTPVKTDIMSLYGSLKTNKKYVDFKTVRKKMEKLAAQEIAAEGL